MDFEPSDDQRLLLESVSRIIVDPKAPAADGT